MNYRNNQFFKSDVFTTGGVLDNERTNPPFVYPDRIVRVLTDTGRGSAEFEYVSGPTLESRAVRLDRGFMRNLNTNLGAGETLPKRRLNFQFNPQDIQQVVSQRENMYLSMLQDPNQFIQPTAGSTSFAFDLLFDRTMEVANNTGQKADLENPGPEDAYDIGVMADLTQLYAIIGQGFSKDLIDYQTKKMKEDARYQYDQNIDDFADADGNVTFNYEAQAARALDRFASNVNIGNAAFLIPQPVRIVFSSLFMVDGFVSSTDIQFTKFNTNMVPIQCKVVLQVNAIYVGFARDKTFLTTQLDKAAEDRTLNREAAKEEQQSKIRIYQQYLNRLRIGFARDRAIIGGVTQYENYKNIQDYAYNYMSFARLATREWDSNTDSGAVGLDLLEDARPGIVVSFYRSEVTDRNKSDNEISDLYESGSTATIQQTIFVDIYGPYDSEAGANLEIDSTTRSKKKVGQYSFSKSATDKDSWKDSITYDLDSLGNDKLNSSNQSPDAITPYNVSVLGIGLSNWDGNGDRPQVGVVSNALANKYFIIYISVRVDITETSGDQTVTVTRNNSATKVYKGSDTGRNETFSFNWSGQATATPVI